MNSKTYTEKEIRPLLESAIRLHDSKWTVPYKKLGHVAGTMETCLDCRVIAKFKSVTGGKS